MKSIKLTILLFAIISHQIADAQGVAFLKNGNLRTVFDTAKAQNKVVAIEVYSPDCHVCQAFKPTFANKITGDFYNPRFISYQMDVASEEANGFLSKQNFYISSIPTLFFFDANVDLLHIQVLGEQRNSPEILVEAAKTALDPQRRTASYAKRFANGERNSNFLTEYGLIARIRKDTTACIAAGNEYFKSLSGKGLVSNTSLLVLEKMIIDVDNGLFQYFLKNLPQYYKLKDKKSVNTIAENILMFSLYSSRGNKFGSAKINEIKAGLAKVGVDQKSILGRVWMHEATANFREKNPAKAMAIIESRVSGQKISPEEGKFLCNFVRSKTTDKTALSKAVKWCK